MSFALPPLARNTLMVFLSPRGYPLGEHRHVGRIAPDLYNESVQLAWWWRFPDGLGAPARTPTLVLPADLRRRLSSGSAGRRLRRAAAVGVCCRWPDGNKRPCAKRRAAGRRRALGIADASLATVVSGSDDDERTELYAKPADRFEVNDVAVRAPEIVGGAERAARASTLATD